MNLQEKLNLLKEKKTDLINITEKKQELSKIENAKNDLGPIRKKLESLKQFPSYSTTFSKDSFFTQVRLIVILDISSSMCGTEKDIYEGLKELCENHRLDNILFTFIVFNEQMKILCKDRPIFEVEPQVIEPDGCTNLNGTLFYTLQNYSDSDQIHNLFVTISDGDNNVNQVNQEDVANLMQRMSDRQNDFYFLGEAGTFSTPDEVKTRALNLGFCIENIEVFTRKSSGNKINFQVISTMLNDLLYKGTVRSNWSEPIKEHYLALTDHKMR